MYTAKKDDWRTGVQEHIERWSENNFIKYWHIQPFILLHVHKKNSSNKIVNLTQSATKCRRVI
jgi:hypothetical protein